MVWFFATELFITFKFFSIDFRFDLCHDFSFWETETGRCIPKKLNDDDNSYAFPPLCNRTEFDCLDSYWTFLLKYCPNKDKSCESYGQKHFFCNISKTCIPKGDLIYPYNFT